MRLVGQLLGSVTATLAEPERDGEGAGTRGHVDGASAGEVEHAPLEAPAVGVPGPAGDGVVDERGPDEDEDQRGKDPAAFGEAAEREDRRDGREPGGVRWSALGGIREETRGDSHHLVQGVAEGRDLGAADGRKFEDAFL